MILHKSLTASFVGSGDILLVIAETAEGMLDRIEDWPEAEIIFADLASLRVNGWSRLARIRERFPLLTLVLCTDEKQALKEKPPDLPAPDHVLQKPVQMGALTEIITKSRRQKA